MTYILFYFKYKRNNLNVTIRVFFLYIFCVIKLSFAKKKKAVQERSSYTDGRDEPQPINNDTWSVTFKENAKHIPETKADQILHKQSGSFKKKV